MTRMTSIRTVLGAAAMAAALLAVSACAQDIDAGSLPDYASIADYDSWPSFDVVGIAPGHGETYRTIYANESAQSYGGVG
ncbi:MAG: hypothetical protein AAGC55_25300, partial [Myxococcota bacterium]